MIQRIALCSLGHKNTMFTYLTRFIHDLAYFTITPAQFGNIIISFECYTTVSNVSDGPQKNHLCKNLFKNEYGITSLLFICIKSQQDLSMKSFRVTVVFSSDSV